jgi:hypothetical protein
VKSRSKAVPVLKGCGGCSIVRRNHIHKATSATSKNHAIAVIENPIQHGLI